MNFRNNKHDKYRKPTTERAQGKLSINMKGMNERVTGSKFCHWLVVKHDQISFFINNIRCLDMKPGFLITFQTLGRYFSTSVKNEVFS